MRSRGQFFLLVFIPKSTLKISTAKKNRTLIAICIKKRYATPKLVIFTETTRTPDWGSDVDGYWLGLHDIENKRKSFVITSEKLRLLLPLTKELKWKIMKIDMLISSDMPIELCFHYYVFVAVISSSYYRSFGVMVSTLDFESSDPSSSPGRTWFC